MSIQTRLDKLEKKHEPLRPVELKVIRAVKEGKVSREEVAARWPNLACKWGI